MRDLTIPTNRLVGFWFLPLLAASGALWLVVIDQGGADFLRYLLPGAVDNAFLFVAQGLAAMLLVCLPLLLEKVTGRLQVIAQSGFVLSVILGTLFFLGVLSSRLTPLTNHCLIKTCGVFSCFGIFSVFLLAFSAKWYCLVQGILACGGALGGYFLQEFSRTDVLVSIKTLSYGNIFAALESCFTAGEDAMLWLVCSIIWLLAAAIMLLLGARAGTDFAN
jgi:hypothetical protein